MDCAVASTLALQRQWAKIKVENYDKSEAKEDKTEQPRTKKTPWIASVWTGRSCFAEGRYGQDKCGIIPKHLLITKTKPSVIHWLKNCYEKYIFMTNKSIFHVII